MRSLQQAVELFPNANVTLIVGVCDDETTLRHKGRTVLTEKERSAGLEHCKWVHEVVEHAPWFLDEDFVKKHRYALQGGGVSGPMVLCDAMIVHLSFRFLINFFASRITFLLLCGGHFSGLITLCTGMTTMACTWMPLERMCTDGPRRRDTSDW